METSRSKSRSQAASVSLRPPYASASSSATSSNNPIVKNILKNVESHVRLMSHLENISTSSSYTALRIRQPSDATAASASGGGATTPSSSQNQQPPLSSQTKDSSVSSCGGSGWSAPFTVTRVHRGTSTMRFYEEVIAPCIANSTSGQSYLFLTNGPHESGRSQTLYGSPHHNEKGVIELAACDYLERMAARGNALMSTEPLSSANQGEEEGQEEGRLGGLMVTYSAFVTRGSHIVETTTGEPVRLEEFPPPLGTVCLPRMQLLEGEGSSAVVIPERKHIDTSCAIQFQVYAPVDASGRRSMSTVTFIDVAALRVPFCKEVQHLVETVQRVAGVAPEGSDGDPRLKDTKLTTLLESALVGYVTLVSITTISGRPDLYESACAALQFASDISRIHQVLMLTHIQAPRWLFETGQHLEQLRGQRDRVMTEHYHRGVYDYYKVASQWLAKHVGGGVDGTVERLLEETEIIRKDIAREASAAAKELQEQIAREDASCREESEAARVAYSTSAGQLDEVKRLDEAIAATELRISQNDLQSNHRISEMRMEISSLAAQTNTRRQEQQQYDKELQLYQLKAREVVTMLDRYAEDLNCCIATHSCLQELEAIGQKRRRLEEDLEFASQAAHRQTDTLRVDRERRSRLSRLLVTQQRVESLRETVCTGSVSDVTASEARRGGSSSIPPLAKRRTMSGRRKVSSSPAMIIGASESP